MTLYARHDPEDAQGIEKVLSFRMRDREEFDRLVRASEAAPPTQPKPVMPVEKTRVRVVYGLGG